jgi:LPXTG-site transpeptidase (sortase) family protein
VTLVLLPGDDDNDAKPQQVTATPDEMVVAPATTTVPQDDETPIPATTQPAATLEDAIPFELPEQPEPTPYLAPEPTGPRYLMIPKLSAEFQVPIPIVQIPLMQESWDVSGLGSYIGWLEGTTWMDPAWGNTVLAAHVQLGTDHPGPFWGIDTLVPGDEIIVEEGDTQYHFVVSSVTPVDPTDWTVTAPTTGPSLTLITCTNWSESAGVFSQRMVVRAVPAQS